MLDLQLVIFDCDGVLVDSETISNEVLARALTAEGLPTTLAQSRRDYQGLLLAEIDSRAQAKLGRLTAMRRRCGRPAPRYSGLWRSCRGCWGSGEQ